MKKLLLILCAVFVTQFAQARWGETGEQIEARYGKPGSRYGKPLKFVKDEASGLYATNYVFKGNDVRVVFQDGKSVAEFVEESVVLDEDAQRLVVEAISGHKKWKGGYGFWGGKNGEIARRDSDGYWFRVESKSYRSAVESERSRREAADKAKAKKSAEGF